MSTHGNDVALDAIKRSMVDDPDLGPILERFERATRKLDESERVIPWLEFYVDDIGILFGHLVQHRLRHRLCARQCQRMDG